VKRWEHENRGLLEEMPWLREHINPHDPDALYGRIADLRNIPLLGYSRAGYPEYFRDVLTLLGGKSAGKKQHSPFAEEYDSGSALIASVQSGQGAALVAEGIGQLAGSGIVLLPLVPRKTAVTLVAAWRGKKAPAAVLPFLEALRTPV
jgi:DNA-binding transcriptional LysR family regulator